MKAALAIILFACVAGSMAADHTQFLGDLVKQGQAVAQTVFAQLQQQLLAAVQQALGGLQSLVGSMGGRFDLDFSALLNQFKPLVSQLVNGALGQVLGSLGSLGGLAGLLGSGRAEFNLGEVFNQLLQQLQATATHIGQQVLNTGLAAILGGLGSLSGSRVFGDIFDALKQHFNTAVSAANVALSGALGGLTQLGSDLVASTKPHLQSLQEQLLNHGLNALGTISESISNIHGSITGN